MKKITKLIRTLVRFLTEFALSYLNIGKEITAELPKEVWVYLDREDYLSLDDDPRMPEARRKKILERYKGIYGRKKYAKTIFSLIVKIEFSCLNGLKEKYLRHKKGDLVIIENGGTKMKLHFASILDRPEIKILGDSSKYVPERWAK
ncbi:MAG: hypothetical protein ACJA2Z_000059 [Candidatus Paceibacteria bacterium]|jgi:hypothetical protein